MLKKGIKAKKYTKTETRKIDCPCPYRKQSA
jgi:hypothetical protein